MAETDVIRCELEAVSSDQLRVGIDRLVAEVGDIDLGCRAVARASERGASVVVRLTRAQLVARAASRVAPELEITELENETELEAVRRAEVATGNRFADRDSRPRGVAKKV
jgi:hypothetical protein